MGTGTDFGLPADIGWKCGKNRSREVPVPFFTVLGIRRPKKGTGTVGKPKTLVKTRRVTEPVPIFGLPSLQFE